MKSIASGVWVMVGTMRRMTRMTGSRCLHQIGEVADGVAGMGHDNRRQVIVGAVAQPFQQAAGEGAAEGLHEGAGDIAGRGALQQAQGVNPAGVDAAPPARSCRSSLPPVSAFVMLRARAV